LVEIKVIPPTEMTTTIVPDVLEDPADSARSKILDAFLEPQFTGHGVWVDSQSPRGGKEVAVGSTVKVHLTTAKRP
jgi:hypothetical protein